MKIATSTTVFRDAIGMRMSITYSEIDDTTGQVVEDNKRLTRVLTDQETIDLATEVISAAQNYIDTLD